MVFSRSLRTGTGPQFGMVQRTGLPWYADAYEVFGKYNGPEEVMDVTDGYTEINVIDNYAPTAKATITVVDENGRPLPEPMLNSKYTTMPSSIP